MSTRTFRTVEDFSADVYTQIFARADDLRQQHEHGLQAPGLLAGKWIVFLVQGNSTRTKALMQAACARLGAACTCENIFDESYSSMGLETVEEALFSYSSLADLLAIRHESLELSTLSSVLEVPVINAMCGPNEHSLAAIGRAYSIWRLNGNLRSSTVGVYGRLPSSRPLKALIKLLSLFGTKVFNDPVLTKDHWPEGHGGAGHFLDSAEITTGSIRSFISEVDALFIAEGLQQKDTLSEAARTEYCAHFEHVSPDLLLQMKPDSIVSVGMPDLLPDGSSTILPAAHPQIQRLQKSVLQDWIFCTQALLCYLLDR